MQNNKQYKQYIKQIWGNFISVNMDKQRKHKTNQRTWVIIGYKNNK